MGKQKIVEIDLTKRENLIIKEQILKSLEYFENKVIEIVGNRYVEILDEVKKNDDIQKIEREDFFNSEKYLLAKKKVSEMNKLAKNGDNTEDFNKEYRIALNDLMTLNTTLNNRLKKYRDRNSELEKELKDLFYINNEKILKAKEDTTKMMAESVLSLAEKFKEIEKEFSLDELLNNEEILSIDKMTGRCLSSISGKNESDLMVDMGDNNMVDTEEIVGLRENELKKKK